MPDVLIRGVPDDDVRALDAAARRLGTTRSALLRQLLHQAAQPAGDVTAADLHWFAGACSDLTDPEIMTRAWS
jgi:hypothetical protein